MDDADDDILGAWKYVRETYIYVAWGITVYLTGDRFLLNVYRVLFFPDFSPKYPTHSTSDIVWSLLKAAPLLGLCVLFGSLHLYTFRRVLKRWDKVGLGLMVLYIFVLLPEIYVAIYNPRYGYSLLGLWKEFYFGLIGLVFFYASRQAEASQGAAVLAGDDESVEVAASPLLPTWLVMLLILFIIAIPPIVIWFLR